MWLKEVLKQPGIEKSTGHSTRAASSSAAKRFNVDTATILQAAGGTNASTFNRFYYKLTTILVRFCYIYVYRKSNRRILCYLLYIVNFYITLFVGLPLCWFVLAKALKLVIPTH